MHPSLYRSLYARFTGGIAPVTRRRFVGESLATAAGLMLSAAHGRAAHAREIDRRVIIVGGGFAGLACGYELKAAGYRITILEARNRLGGRVVSLRDLVAGKVVEGGGEFIGSNHPAWLAYAERFKLPLIELDDAESINSPLILGGKPIAKLTALALFQEMTETFAKLTEKARDIDADIPWKSDHARALDNQSVAAWLDEQKLSSLGRRCIEAQFVPYSGVVTAEESMLSMLAAVKGGGLEKYWTENEAFRCRGGNDQLARKLAAVQGEGEILLNSPVSEIHTSDNGAHVKCADGRVFFGDDVVLAIPPPTWREISFAPLLPKELRPQMGANVKQLSVVREAFWKRTKQSPLSLSDGLVGVTWNGTEGEGDGEQALVAFAGGPAADQLRRMPLAERDARFKSEVQHRYAEFDKNLLRTRFMDWPAERWTGGSYVTPAPGQVTIQGPILAAGLGRLHFAGEHTCLKFVGFMEGALESGVAVAKRLAVRDGLAK